MKNKSIFNSIAVIVGTAVGAGIFALPYAAAKAGVSISLFYLIALGLVSLIILLAYGEIVLRTPERAQIIGYTKKYLGNKWKIVATVSFLFGITGALIAYSIGVGEFIDSLIGPVNGGSAYLYGLIYFIIVSIIILTGLGTIVQLERIMVVLLILVVGLIIFFGLPEVKLENLTTFSPLYMFLPYGVILFAISAASAIPDAVDALPDRKKLFRAIKVGSVIPLVIYILFSVVIVGICGSATHEEAIPGLVSYLQPWLITSGIIFGIISMTTSFLALGLVIKEIYNIDFKLPKFWAWLVAMTPPFLVYVFKLANFVSIISLVGGIMGGFDGIIIILMWRQARKMGTPEPECKINIPNWLQILIITVFAAGIIYEIYYNLIK